MSKPKTFDELKEMIRNAKASYTEAKSKESLGWGTNPAHLEAITVLEIISNTLDTDKFSKMKSSEPSALPNMLFGAMLVVAKIAAKGKLHEYLKSAFTTTNEKGETKDIASLDEIPAYQVIQYMEALNRFYSMIKCTGSKKPTQAISREHPFKDCTETEQKIALIECVKKMNELLQHATVAQHKSVTDKYFSETFPHAKAQGGFFSTSKTVPQNAAEEPKLSHV